MAYIPELLAFEETLATSYDLTSGPTTFTSSDISDYNRISVQFVGSSIRGDTEVMLQQSNDGTNYDDLENGEIFITPTNSAFTLERTVFTGKFLRISLDITDRGTLPIYLVAKR